MLTEYTTRKLPQSDLGFLLTKLGTLTLKDGTPIAFKTGQYVERDTQWTERISLN